MGLWIEYDESLWDFWKVKRLARLLEVPYAHALGLVSCLWTWTVRNSASSKVPPRRCACRPSGASWRR